MGVEKLTNRGRSAENPGGRDAPVSPPGLPLPLPPRIAMEYVAGGEQRCANSTRRPEIVPHPPRGTGDGWDWSVKGVTE